MTSSAGSSRPGPAARRGRPGYDQETVLRRAIELFNTHGYDGTSMGDLARELGLTKSAIYHHVPSKETLLSQALEESLGQLTAAVERAGADDGRSAYDRLRDVLEESVAVLVDHQPSVTLLLRVRGNSDVERAALDRRRWIDARLADLVRAAAADGVLRDDVDPALVSRLLLGMVNSLVDWYRPGGPVDTATLLRTVTALVFDGLLRR